MIVATITKNNNMTTIELDGHANYGPLGQDIVCAYVSAISDLLEGYIFDLRKDGDKRHNCKVKEDGGYGLFLFKDPTDEEKVLIQNVVDRLLDASVVYADQVKVIEKEGEPIEQGNN